MDKFSYTPDEVFNDTSAYSDPQSESEVREQLSRPHKQVETYINNTLIPAINKGNTDIQSQIDDTLTPAIEARMKTATYDADGNGIVDNAEKVNGHTVEADVPASAAFTDTTYSQASASVTGIAKMYDATGTATDGSMTQKAITDAIISAAYKDVTIDSEMSDSSENPVQNKTIKGYVDNQIDNTNNRVTELEENMNSGLPPADANLFIVSKHAEGTTVYLQWDVPKYTKLGTAVICTTAGVMIRRSTSAYPASETDGDLVINTAELTGKHEDTGLTAGQEYYYTIFPYSDHKVYNYNTVNRAHVTAKGYKLYGVKITKATSSPSGSVAYTEDAIGMTPAAVNLSTGVMDYGSWADVFFVAKNRPVMVNRNGVVSYELDHSNHALKIDGTASDIAEASQDLNAMAEFPTIWLKEWEDDTFQYINVSDVQVDSDYKAYAATRQDGTVADTWYYPMFKGSVVNNRLRSLSGKAPYNGGTASTEINYAGNVGPAANITSWSQAHTIGVLMLMMGKSTNTQVVFGNGHYSDGSSSDSLLKTGGTLTKGQFYGTSGNTYMKAFYIENFYGDRWDRINGLVTNSSTQVLAKMTPPYNLTGDGYTNTGIVPSGTSGSFVSQASVNTDYGIIGKTVSGSDSTYWADGLWYAASCFALFGGSCADGLVVGAFCVALNSAASNAYWFVGASLSLETPSL